MDIVIIIIIIILIIIIIFLIAYSVNISISKIDPVFCPVVNGSYGVTTNKSIDILELCGKNKNSKCTFYSIQSLYDAEIRCNVIPDVCSAFTYSDATKIMNIVNPISNEYGSYNIYSRQYNENIIYN